MHPDKLLVHLGYNPDLLNKINLVLSTVTLWDNLFNYKFSGLSLRAGGRGFPPGIMNMTPGYFQSKIEPKEL